MAGTEIMTIAKLDDMEARVDVGEVDVVLIKLGQRAQLEVDSFRDRKFSGIVTEIANAAMTTAPGQQQESTKFEVKIRINEKELFRPGMSVTAEIETRYRSNVVTIPIQSVTMRLPKGAKDEKAANKPGSDKDQDEPKGGVIDRSKKKSESVKPVEVIFEVADEKAKMVPVKRGINNDEYVEILEGVKEGDEVVSGGFKAINRELEDGKKIKRGPAKGEEKKEANPTP
jgi:HlyD family secretion protein